MRLVYSALLYLLVPFVLLRLAWRGFQLRAYRERIPERFGFVTAPFDGVAVWVHAVSVGEVVAAVPLIEALLQRHGPRSVWVTTMTPTGSERVRGALGDRVHHSYVPYDLPDAVARFLARVQPRQVVIMETELWPNLFHAVAARVTVMGNIKFDLTLPLALIEQGRQLRREIFGERPAWIAASTHEGEDEQVLAAHAAVVRRVPAAILILVPRHPQRFDAVARAIEKAGFHCLRRTTWQAAAQSPSTAPRVLLGDSMGEMFLYFAAADVAFVGGSLVPVGGHNVLEPAAVGLPVLFGPHMFNFLQARDLLLSSGAGQQVNDAGQLEAALVDLLLDPARRDPMGRAGQAAVEANRGALDRLLQLLEGHG